MRPLFCLLIFSAISGVWFHGDHHPLVFGLRLCDQQGKRDSFFSHPTELRTHCCGLIFLLISSRGLKESASRKSTQSVVEGALSKRALSFVPTPCARFNACPPRILMAWSIVRRIYSDTDTSISLSSLPPLLSSLRSGVHLPCLHRFIFSLSLSTVCIWVRLIVSFLLDVLLVQSVCPPPPSPNLRIPPPFCPLLPHLLVRNSVFLQLKFFFDVHRIFVRWKCSQGLGTALKNTRFLNYEITKKNLSKFHYGGASYLDCAASYCASKRLRRLVSCGHASESLRYPTSLTLCATSGGKRFSATKPVFDSR